MLSELEFAIDVVGKACALTKAIQKSSETTVLEKGDKSPVTVADYASQLFITHNIQKAFPQIGLLAEENIAELGKAKSSVLDQISGWLSAYIENYSLEEIVDRTQRFRANAVNYRYWVLDPIDGTKGFLRGDQFAIALALIENGTPVLGVVGCPNLGINAEPDHNGSGIIAYAEKGQGAWIQKIGGQQAPVRLTVSRCSDASMARFLTSVDSSQHSNNDEITALKLSLKNQVDIHQFDSQAKYVMVAAGIHDLFIRIPPQHQQDYREKVWDHAAGSLLVSEAGGMVTDLQGREFDFSQGASLRENSGVVVSNALFHQTIVNFFRTKEKTG